VKVNPSDWKQVPPNKWLQGPLGRLKLQLPQAQPIWVRLAEEGVEVIVTVDHSATVTFDAPFEFMFEGDRPGFVHAPHVEIYEHLDEVFTNEDMMPHESGHLAEVTSAMRQFKLLALKEKAEIAQQMAILKATRKERTDTVPAGDVAPAEVVAEAKQDDPE